MSRVTISCESCGQKWLVATPYSIYEQQATESCPCPRCGAYTLCCREAAEAPQTRRLRGPHRPGVLRPALR